MPRLRTLLLSLLVLALLLIPGTVAWAQQPDAPTDVPAQLHLQAATFDPLTDGAPLVTANLPLSTSPYYLVQFTGPVGLVAIEQIRALGGEILGYVPDNAHIVRMAAAVAPQVQSLPAVRWVGPYQPSYKLAPSLAVATLAAMNGAADGTEDATPTAYYVLAFAGESLSALESFLLELGATVQQATESPLGPVLQITIAPQAVARIAQHPAVSWIEPYLQPQLYNAEGRKLMGVEAIWQENGYFGAGQIIAISDSGLSVQNTLSRDFQNRVIRAFAPSEMNLANPGCQAKTDWTDLNGHGTHVAGSVLGSGALSGGSAATHRYNVSNAGSAPEARMVFMALNTDGSSGIQCISNNGDFIAKGYVEGARISTNSWGSNDSGAYGFLSSLVDDYIWRHQDYLVLYAGGNAGPSANTIGSPGTAKNVLTVGASENNRPSRGELGDNPNTVTSFSSRGPTADGRIKPDVVAPGSWVLSVRGAQADSSIFEDIFDGNYAYLSGTSMATPLTAGAAALVREWLAKARFIQNPSAALLKALIINGTTQLPGSTLADPDSGYGRVGVQNTIQAQYALLDDHLQGLTTGLEVTYTVNVVSNNAMGLLVASDSVAATEISTAELSSFVLMADLVTDPALAASATLTDPTRLRVAPLPGYDAPPANHPIPTLAGSDKSQLAPLNNPLPTLALTGTQSLLTSSHFQPSAAGTPPQQMGYQLNLVGGGTFEDPEWTDHWQYVWLGSGVPARNCGFLPDLIIEGDCSMWLGGTPITDALLYPIQFPDEIDNVNDSRLYLELIVVNEDIEEDVATSDIFCVALTNVSGDLIGPFASTGAGCIDDDGSWSFELAFTAAERQALAGQAAYLSLVNYSDGLAPHMSAFVDNVVLVVDYPDVALDAIPPAGPAGTTFLLTGKYNIPYGVVDLCVAPCSAADDFIDTVYADGAGNVNAYLLSEPDIPVGDYTLKTIDAADREGAVTVTIVEAITPTLTVAPKSGVAGTNFAFTGNNFLPNANIAVALNGESLGTTGSNSSGRATFQLQTSSTTPPGNYSLRLTDSLSHTAVVVFRVTALGINQPTITVSPTVGAPGTSFVFSVRKFMPEQAADILLDGQELGRATTDAAGNLELTLNTQSTTAPGSYTLMVAQGSRQASAQFTITGDDDAAQSGRGLYITLAWVDPPGQSFAAKMLVNDLDLLVEGSSGTFYGNGGTRANRTDNVEIVRLEDPAPGRYVVTVSAFSVNATYGAQPYALVATVKQEQSPSGSVWLDAPTSGPESLYLPLVAE